VIAKKIYAENGEVQKTIGNIPDGIVSRYYSNGALESTIEYKNNKLTEMYYVL